MIDKGGRAYFGDKKDLITYTLTYKDVYEDYPFRDHEIGLSYATGAISGYLPGYTGGGTGLHYLKCAPQWIEFGRKAYSGKSGAAYHLE